MSRRHQSLRQAFVTTIAVAAASVAGGGCLTEQVITNPPPVDLCPASEPANGAVCNHPGASCEFTDGCSNPITYECDGGVWNVTASVSCNPPPPDLCPESIPFFGEPCASVGLICAFGPDGCGFDVTGTCTDQGWQTDQGTCNPPPAECPVDFPAIGSACEAQPDTIDTFPSFCGYDVDTPCGVQTVVASCVFEAEVWTWAFETPPSCEAPPEQCQAYGDASTCDADAGCSWRVPGCSSSTSAPALEAAGCFPTADCTTDGCGDWGTCALVTYNPCWNSLCDACGAEANVCIPN